MDPTTVLLLVVGLMGLNQLVMRVGGLKARPGVFWPLQAINVLTGSVILVYGLPGFEHHLQPVSWIVGLLFIFRTVLNNNHRAAWLREQYEEAEEDERSRAVREALKRGEEERGSAEG